MALSVLHHVAHDSGSTNQTSLGVPVTATTVGNDMVIVVGAGAGTTNTINGITDDASGGSNTYSLVPGSFASTSGGGWTAQYQAHNTRGGATTVTIAFSSQSFPWAVAYELAGYTSLTVADAQVLNNQAATASPTGATVTTGAAGIAIAGITTEGAITVNPKAGNAFTSGGDITVNDTCAACSLVYNASGTKTPQWDESGGNFCASTVAYEDAGGGGGLTAAQQIGIFDQQLSGSIIGRVDA